MKGETREKAFQRIARDELHRHIPSKDAEFLGIPFRHYYPNEEKLGKTVDIHYEVLPFVIRVAEEFELKEDKQHWEYKWFGPDDLLKNKSVHQYTKDFFNWPLKIPNDSGIYRALVSLYIHYDRQFWSRTQILLVVQGAVLIGGYNLRSFWLGPAIMLMGFVVNLIVLGLIFRDVKSSRVNQSRMDQLAKKIFDYCGPEWPVRLRSDPRTRWLSGRFLIYCVVIGLMILNLALGWLYLKYSVLRPLTLFPPTTAQATGKLEGDVKDISTAPRSLEVHLSTRENYVKLGTVT